MGNAGAGAVLDCAEAAIVHSIQCWTHAATGTSAPFVNQDALNLYESWTGYTPGNPSTDLGTILSFALDKWASPGITDDNGVVHTILSTTQLNTGDPDDLAQACYLLGPVMVGFNLCAQWDNAFAYSALWDAISPAPATPTAHCAPVIGRNSAGNFIVSTFGGLLQMTPAGYNQFSAGAFAFTTEDYMNSEGLSPLGYSLAQLTHYQSAMNAAM
jgi:hypothetical protein